MELKCPVDLEFGLELFEVLIKISFVILLFIFLLKKIEFKLG